MDWNDYEMTIKWTYNTDEMTIKSPWNDYEMTIKWLQNDKKWPLNDHEICYFPLGKKDNYNRSGKMAQW